MENSIGSYTNRKRSRSIYRIIDIRILEENLTDYRSWLIKTHRDDKIENYKKFLKAK